MNRLPLLFVLLPLLCPDPARAAPAAVDIDSIQALWSSGARDSALTIITVEVERVRALADSVLLTQLLLREGAYRASFGEHRIAEKILDETMTLASSLGDSTVLVSAIRWLSIAVGSQGRGAEADELYLRLLDVARALGDRRHQGWAMVGMAWSAWKRGDGESAAEHYEQAAERFSGTDDVEGELWAHNGLAMVRTEHGDYEDALASYRHSLARAREAGLPMSEAIALNGLGSLEYPLGLPDQALDHFRQAAAIHAQLNNKREEILPQFNIAMCLNDLGRSDDARENLEGVLAICVDEGYADLEISALVKLAETLVLLGRYNAAIDRFQQALDPEREMRLGDRLNARIGLSEALVRQGSNAEALAELEAAEALLAGSVQNWAMHRILGKQGRALARLGRHREALDHLLETAKLAETQGLLEFRFAALADAAHSCEALALQDSALALYEEAAEVWASERRLLLDPAWRERRGSSGRRIFTDLAAQLLARGDGAAAFDRLQTYKGRTLAERMLGPGSRYERFLSRQTLASTSLAALQDSVLSEDELFLDFYLGPRQSLLFAVSRRGFNWRTLPAADELDGRLRAYHELLASPAAATPEDIAAVGESISNTLFGKSAELLGGYRRLIVSPDGALNLLPFAELPGCAERLWIRAPSATVLEHVRSVVGRERKTEPWTILALASGSSGDGRLLEGAIREVKQVHRRFRHVDLRRPDQDSRQFTPADLNGFDILHIAAHATSDDQSPWQSAIEFKPGDAEGRLRAAEITELRLDACLTILSSCGSGTGGILSGEGVLGLSSAFISAGVPSVLATLWAVDDAATAHFVELFYSALGKGEPCGAALASAQAGMRAHPETSHPYYWAGFVIIGDGGVQASLAKRIPSAIIAGLAAVAGILVLGLILRRRRAWIPAASPRDP